jgi:hypothetical protein
MFHIATCELACFLSLYSFWAVLLIIAFLVLVQRNEQRLLLETGCAFSGLLAASSPVS